MVTMKMDNTIINKEKRQIKNVKLNNKNFNILLI